MKDIDVLSSLSFDSDFYSSLLDWFSIHKRKFFWRQFYEPYPIMIAEFMLHRTKAAQVEPVYKDFLTRYPDVFSLANAEENSIQKVTEHLGLHWRSTHFIEAAQFLVEHHNGAYPQNREELLKVPGIGDYVAGAILTVCFCQSEYVVDSNIARFIDRYFDLKLSGEIRRKKEIKVKAIELFNFYDTRKLLFAILDFTALICKPIIPECTDCPLDVYCQYKMKIKYE